MGGEARCFDDACPGDARRYQRSRRRRFRRGAHKGRGPALGYCKTGRRATALWALSQAKALGAEAVLAAAKSAGVDIEPLQIAHRRARERRSRPGEYDVVIIGGGSGGIAAAASLLKRRPSLAVAIVEPAGCALLSAGLHAGRRRRVLSGGHAAPHGVGDAGQGRLGEAGGRGIRAGCE